MRKLFFLILLVVPSVCWGQFATTMDSSDVAGWNFSTFTDTDDSLKAGYQIFQKIDTTDAVIDSAVGAERAAVAVEADSASGFTHDGIKDYHIDWGSGANQVNLDDFDDQTAWQVLYTNIDGDVTELALGADGTYLKSNGASSTPTFATPPGGDPGSAIDDSIKNGWQIYQKIDTTSAVRAAIHDSLDANWSTFIADDTVDTYREAIHDSLDANWAVFTAGGGGTSNADSIVHIPVEDTTGNIGDIHGLLFNETNGALEWEEFWATPVTAPTDNYLLKIDTDPDPDTLYWAADNTGGLSAQSVKGDHVDSTAENFVFDGAYHYTSEEADSAYLTHGGAAATYLTGNESITLSGDATGSGATAIAVTVVDDLHDHVYSNIDETTSANWIGRVSDETGTGAWVFGTSPILTTPSIVTSITMPDDAWIGVSADSVRIVFDTTEKDLIKVSNGKLRIIDNNACLELEDDSGNEGRIKVGNSQMAIEIDPDDLILSSDICIKIDGSEVARFHQSTNFGIGTLSPSERLSVEGNAVITGRITSGDTLTKSFVIASIDDTFDFPFWQTKRAIIIVAVSAVCTGGTNVIGALQEYNATGTSVDAAVDGDWTITTSEYTDASFTNAGIDAGDWLGWKTTSVSGSVTFFSITFEYTEQ